MVKAYVTLVAVWGLLITCLPWFVVTDAKSLICVIISGIGLLIIGSAVLMWHKAG